MQVTDLFGEVTYSYTRQQAIEDGVLVDVSSVAQEAGFRIPVAITAGVHNMIGDIPASKSYQDYAGRLWDVLYMCSMGARNNTDKSEFLYELILHHGRKTYATLKCVIHGGDSSEPVITIMLPNED